MSSSSTKLIDLSHPIEHGRATYPDLPAPVVSEFLSRKDSRTHYGGEAEFHIGKIEMVANTGTYVDAPFHRFADGKDVAALSLGRLADLPGIVVDATERSGRAIDVDRFRERNVRGRAVLVHTGWDEHWQTDQYFEGHPYLTEAAAIYLADEGAALVGIDSLNIDDTGDDRRPVHTTLLKAGIPIVEHLCNLDPLPRLNFRFFAVPPRVKGLGSFPVRAFARVETSALM